MKKTNLRRHNLNALPVLREILKHGNLTRAAKALGLTQPALSNILKQLRIDFDDMLIVRQGQKMQLTVAALELVEPLEQAMQLLENLFSSTEFDPAHSDRVFRIATSDFVITQLGTRLAGVIAKDAPGVSIQMQAAQRSSVQALMVGEIDMIISPTILLTSGVASQPESESVETEVVLREQMVCLARADDRAFAKGLTLDEYLARPHAGYIFGNSAGSSMEQVYMQRLGLRQNDKMLVASYAALAPIVAETGFLALVPESMARAAIVHYPLQYARPPFAPVEMEWSTVWHKRQDRRSDMQWLRAVIKRLPAR
ncbi:MAG: LysR family transcriptional regulator [Sphingorhabdus sp.]